MNDIVEIGMEIEKELRPELEGLAHKLGVKVIEKMKERGLPIWEDVPPRGKTQSPELILTRMYTAEICTGTIELFSFPSVTEEAKKER